MESQIQPHSSRLGCGNVRYGLILAVLLVASCVSESFAQMPDNIPTDSVWVEVVMNDGNRFIGRKISETFDAIILRTENLGEIKLPKIEIRVIRPTEKKKLMNDGYWFDNGQASRTFFAPTGYSLRPGEAYYQNIWVVFNQFSVGITKNVSCGIGLIPTFLFGSADMPMWVTPKLSFPLSRDKVNVGIAALVGTTAISEKGNGFGVIYGVTTFGSRDRNISIGAGLGYSRSSFAKTPIISVSGLLRVSAKGYIMTENYIWSPSSNDGGPGSLISFGGRRLVNRTGIDFGLFIPIADNNATWVAIPWLGITAPLDKRY